MAIVVALLHLVLFGGTCFATDYIDICYERLLIKYGLVPLDQWDEWAASQLSQLANQDPASAWTTAEITAEPVDADTTFWNTDQVSEAENETNDADWVPEEASEMLDGNQAMEETYIDQALGEGSKVGDSQDPEDMDSATLRSQEAESNLDEEQEAMSVDDVAPQVSKTVLRQRAVQELRRTVCEVCKFLGTFMSYSAKWKVTDMTAIKNAAILLGFLESYIGYMKDASGQIPELVLFTGFKNVKPHRYNPKEDYPSQFSTYGKYCRHLNERRRTARMKEARNELAQALGYAFGDKTHCEIMAEASDLLKQRANRIRDMLPPVATQ